MDTNPEKMPSQLEADNQPRPGYKRCANCGKTITPGGGQRREYCNAACKQAAYRTRKEAAIVTQ